jgi:tetratricopeptide (TPR) repeat protein
MRGRLAPCGAKRRFIAALALVLTATTPTAAQAQPTSASPPTAQRDAEQHYQKARELYQSGAYREALAELEAAHTLDPNAKELVFNLGVVNEKLGKIDDALRYFRQYAQFDGLSAQEKQKADNFIRRLEGAKREIPPQPPPQQPPPQPPPQPSRPPERGRFDAATAVAGVIALAGLGVGATFGIKALVDKPKQNFTTGKDGSFDDLQRARDDSYSEARIADVSLAVGVVAAAVTAYLYFGRTKAPQVSNTRAQVSAAPVPGGGAFVVQGKF